jgi:hypothetical protein
MRRLNEYSQHFAEVLFEAFPDWKQFSSVGNAKESDEAGFLVVKVPAPAKGLLPSKFIPDDEDFLTIDSNGEITVDFDYWHSHFDKFSHFSEAENFADALETIKSIVDEKICVVVVLSDGAWCGSSSIGAGEKPDLSRWHFTEPFSGEVFVRSWRGTYNQKYTVAEVRGEK